MNKKYRRGIAASLAVLSAFNCLTTTAIAAKKSSTSDNMATALRGGAGYGVEVGSTLSINTAARPTHDLTKTEIDTTSESGGGSGGALGNSNKNEKPALPPFNFANSMMSVINNGNDNYYKTYSKAYIDPGEGRGVSVIDLMNKIEDTSQLVVNAPQADSKEQGDAITKQITEKNTISLEDILVFYLSDPSYVDEYGLDKGNTTITGVTGQVTVDNVRVFYGYVPEFEGYRGKTGETVKSTLPESIVVDKSTVTADARNDYLNTGSEGYETPYKNLFETDDEGVVEDAYILIRKLLGTDNVEDKVIDNAVIKKNEEFKPSDSKAYEEVLKEAASLQNYMAERTEWVANEVEKEVAKIEEKRTKALEEAEEAFEAAIESWQASQPKPPSTAGVPPEQIAAIISAFSAAVNSWQNQRIPIEQNYVTQVNDINTEFDELIAETRDDYGSFKNGKRQEYNGNHMDSYLDFRSAAALFDGNGTLDINYGSNSNCINNAYGYEGNVADAGGSVFGDVEETSNFNSEDGIEALLWYLWITDGVTGIPEESKIKTIEAYIGNAEETEKVLMFRKWLIEHELYFNNDYEGGYTLDQNIYSDELLQNWAAVYGDNKEDIEASLENLGYPSNIADIYCDSKMGSEYPYLEGYTNASYITVNGSDYLDNNSILSRAIQFYDQFGLIDGDNIPDVKKLSLRYYTDVKVTGYSNDNMYTSSNFVRYEWYVYYSATSDNKDAADVVYHATTTAQSCPFTPTAQGRYWVECYQSGKRSFGEHLEYSKANFLVDESTQTVLMSVYTQNAESKLDEKLVAEKTLLLSDEDGYYLESGTSAQWRASGNTVLTTFSTERVSD